MTDFQDALSRTPLGPGRWSAEVAEDWTQGRTAFGGLVAAIAVDAARELAGPDRPVRSVDVAFVAPVPAGPVVITAEVLGAGRSATQVSVSVSTTGPDGEVLGSRAHVVLGAARASVIQVPVAIRTPPPEGDPAEQGLPLPFIPGVTPTFTQHVEFRWCGETFPFTGGGPESTRLLGWCRHRTPAAGLAATVAMLDAWPPAALTMAPAPAPASTVRWSLQLVGDGASAAAAGDWFWFESEVVSAADGYAVETATLWLHGRPVAWAEQTVAVYDRPRGV